MSAADTVALGAGIAAAAAALANWWSRLDRARAAGRVELVSKPLATIAIGTFAVASAADDVPTAALVAAVIGFVLCLVGDVALLPAVDRFIPGLASFLAGHLAFVVMFVALGLDRWWLGAIALVGVAVVVRLVGRTVLRGARERDPALAAPVAAYLAVISSMAVVGWATGNPAAIIGSSLFVLSDSILGWRLFVRAGRFAALAVMVTYHGALLGLALTLVG
ncbi:MAG: hypothetical protein F2534_23105 [Actinobacteria bacterium]|uniref:Unannotated protein n=1 Tax=freshwater metagenome TaxID=449393 RepID=A0A6J6GTW9_9ZZZZ|nr:hypothetical protein [Actinomycetota bacterium]